MLYNNLPTAFPFYDKKEKQLRFKAGSQFNFPHLISPKDAILPFQFRKQAEGKLPISWKLYDLTDTLISDLSQYIIELGVQALEGNDYFWMARSIPMIIGDPTLLEMFPGCYYCVFEFDTANEKDQFRYSETFRVPENSFSVNAFDQVNFISIQWKNVRPVSPIYYPTEFPEFYNNVYLDTRVISSEPEIESEVEKDGNNVEVPIFQRAIIKYRISAFVSDFLKIALYLLPLHDTVFLTTEALLEVGKMKNISLEASVEEGGLASTLQIVFEQELLIVGGPCTGMKDDECPPMPSNESMNLQALGLIDGSGRKNISATLPADIYGAELWGVKTGDDHFYGFYTRAQLLAHFLVGPAVGVTGIYIKPKSFNCTLGTSNIVPA